MSTNKPPRPEAVPAIRELLEFFLKAGNPPNGPNLDVFCKDWEKP